jgi:serine protease Do
MNHDVRLSIWQCKTIATVDLSPSRESRGQQLRRWCFLACAVLIQPILPASASVWSAWFTGRAQQTPHPAVVRVSVQEQDGISQGSGTLVEIREQYGLVVTNWHVVRDASGGIQVIFPDGYRSAARVLSTDRDWDLAALLIWRPSVKPVPLAPRAPRPGERLTIAGYGPGNYRAVDGRCTQYVSPGANLPFEMVEVSARARQGDSGGPIFNADGQLAGVLFGSGGGTTSGSFAGRVQSFLATAWPPSLPYDQPGQLANLDPPPTGLSDPASDLHDIAPQRPLPDDPSLVPLPSSDSNQQVVELLPATPAFPTAASDVDETSVSGELSWQDLAGKTLFDQVKSVLATIGACAVILQVGRFLLSHE